MVNLQIGDTILTNLTIVADIIIVLFVLDLIRMHLIKSRKFSNSWELISNRFLLFSFIVALIATLGSLYYSDILGYEPCKLCWYQRIFMYPQVILLGVASLKKHKSIAIYSLLFSIIGAIIAAYHYLGQIGSFSLPCSAVGYSSSCAETFILNYGYITIPMMALSAFSLIIIAIVLYISKKSS